MFYNFVVEKKKIPVAVGIHSPKNQNQSRLHWPNMCTQEERKEIDSSVTSLSAYLHKTRQTE